MANNNVIRGFGELLKSNSGVELLAAYRVFLDGLSDEDKNYADILLDFHLNNIKISSNPDYSKIIVVPVHGIRTQSHWQEKLRSICSDKGIKVIPIGYGWVDVFRFLSPIVTRERPVNIISRELRDILRTHPDHSLVVVAHSFGTYVVTRILREAPDIKVCRLLLCGSVVRDDYRWDNLPGELSRSCVVNEVGTKDVFPVLARVSSFGYGCTGTFGFKTSRVTDRFFPCGHSDFFEEKHIVNFWLPFISDGTILPSEWDSQRPTASWWLSFLGGFPFIKLIVFLPIACIFFMLYWHLF